MRLVVATFGLRCLLAAMGGPAAAQPLVSAPEDDVKSALILGFVRYSEWPPAPGIAMPGPAVLLLGVFGRPTLTRALARLVEGKYVGGRPLAARNVRTPGEAARCDVLFLAAGSKRQLHEFLTAVHDLPVLTIGDSDGILDLGGMVQLFQENDQIRFAVSLDALSRSRISVSARLLRLGQVVGGRKR